MYIKIVNYRNFFGFFFVFVDFLYEKSHFKPSLLGSEMAL
jgi:hypothetical protein